MAVPDTNTFDIQDVHLVVKGPAPYDSSLIELFSLAVNEFFDPRYAGARNSLLNFRGYSNYTDVYAYAIVAPTNFGVPSGQVNIIRIYSRYKTIYSNIKYAYTVSTDYVITVLSNLGASIYECGETVDGVEKHYTMSTGTITWTLGSTKRYVVVIGSNSNQFSAIVPVSASWVYFGNQCYSIRVVKNANSIMYMHCEDPTTITNIPESAFDGCVQLTGVFTAPLGLNHLEARSFAICYGITKVILHTNIDYLNNETFYDFRFTRLDIHKRDYALGVNPDTFDYGTYSGCDVHILTGINTSAYLYGTMRTIWQKFKSITADL